jgi:hypothetical protein
MALYIITSINSVEGRCAVTNQSQYLETLRENVINMKVKRKLNYNRITRSLTYTENELLDFCIINN